MSQALITEAYLTDIANAIRSKRHISDTFYPSEMAVAILAIHTADLENLTATSNGTYTPSANKDGFGQVVVQVPVNLENLTATSNGTYTPSANKDGFGQVVVQVPVNVPYTVSEYGDAIVFTGTAVSSQSDAIVLTT